MNPKQAVIGSNVQQWEVLGMDGWQWVMTCSDDWWHESQSVHSLVRQGMIGHQLAIGGSEEQHGVERGRNERQKIIKGQKGVGKGSRDDKVQKGD